MICPKQINVLNNIEYFHDLDQKGRIKTNNVLRGSLWSSGSALARGQGGPRFESRLSQVVFWTIQNFQKKMTLRRTEPRRVT